MAHVHRQNIHHAPLTDIGDILTYAGVEYEASWRQLIVAPEAKIYVRAQTSAEKYTVLNTRHLVMDQERGFYRTYSVFTGGAKIADVIPTKIRLDSAVVPTGIFETWSAPDTIDADSLINEEPLFGAAGQGNRQGAAGRSKERALRILPPGAVVLLEFENASVAATYFTAIFRFWEVSEAFLPDSEAY